MGSIVLFFHKINQWSLPMLFLCGLQACSTYPKIESRHFVVEREWIKATFEKESLQYRRLNRMKPIVTDSIVVAGNAINDLVAFDRMKGKKLWSRFFRGGVEGGAQVVDQKLLFGANDGIFYAINIQTGLTEWTFPVQSEVLGEPRIAERIVYILSGDNVLHALNVDTGQQVWTYNRMDSSQFSIRGGSRPLVVDSLVYTGFSDGSFVALNKSNGSMVWEVNLNHNKRFRDVDSAPILDGDNIYVSSFDGALYCLDKKTGSIRWRADDGGYSGALIKNNTVYYGTTNGKFMALDKKSGKILWTFKGVRGYSTEPIYYRGLVIFGESEGALSIIDAQTGTRVGEYKTGRGVTSSPFLDDETGQIYFMSANALLYRIHLDWRVNDKYWPWD